MKNLFILCLVVLSTSFVQAQKFSFGAKVGANYHNWFSNYSNKNLGDKNTLFDAKPQLGYEFGVTARQKLSKKFSLNEEVLYTERSVSVLNFIATTPRIMLKTQYIAVPVFVSYNICKPLSFDLGGEYSRIVSSSSPFFKSIFDNLNAVSAIAGLSIHLSEKSKIQFRYIRTLTKISEVDWTDYNANVVTQEKVYSHSLNLAFGYQF